MKTYVEVICRKLVDVGRKNKFCKYAVLAVFGFLWFAAFIWSRTKQFSHFAANNLLPYAKRCGERGRSIWRSCKQISARKTFAVVIAACMALSAIQTTAFAVDLPENESGSAVIENGTAPTDDSIPLPEDQVPVDEPEKGEPKDQVPVDEPAKGEPKALLTEPLAADAITIKINSNPNKIKGSSLQNAIGDTDLSTITKLYIMDGAFTADDWIFLKTLSALTYFDANAWYAIDSIAEMPEGVAFPATIKNVYVSKLQTVKKAYFTGCSELEQCNFSDATAIEDEAFYAKTKLTSSYCPKVETIGAYAFFGTAIKEVKFPKVESIGIADAPPGLPSCVFSSCSELKKVEFPIAEYIEPNSFENCVKLETAIFPKVKEIGSSAFQSTADEGMALVSADFSSVETIGANAFQGCIKLKSMTLPTTPPTVADANAFNRCPAAREIKWATDEGSAKAAYKAADDGNAKDDSWYGWPLRTNPITAVVDGDDKSGTSLENALEGYSAPVSIEIVGGKVTDVDWKWVQSETAKTGNGKLNALEHFKISGSTIVADMPVAGKSGATADQEKSTFPASLKTVSIVNLDRLDDNNTVYGNAFRNCINLTSASFPDTTYIGNSSFRYCNKLETVDFPKAKTIDGNAFKQKENASPALKKVNFPEVTEINTSAFERCTSLETVSFPKVSYLGIDAFRFCSALEEVSFPNVNRIAEGVFKFCTKLKSVEFARENLTIPGHSTTPNIGQGAFNYCTSLKTIKFGSKTPPKMWGNADKIFEDCPTTRWLELADDTARTAYDSDPTNSGVATDGKWYGWFVKQPKVLYLPITQEQVNNVFGEGGATFTEPDEITLDKDIILTDTIEISTDVTLDLNGNTITGPNGKNDAASTANDGKPAIEITDSDVDLVITNSGEAAEIIGGSGGDGGTTNPSGGNGGSAIVIAGGVTGGKITADDKVTIIGGNGGSATTDANGANGGNGGNGADIKADTVVSGGGSANGGNGGNVPDTDNAGNPGTGGAGVSGGTEITINTKPGASGFKVTTEVKLDPTLPIDTTVTAPSKDLADAVVTKDDTDKNLDIKVNLNVAPKKALESERVYIDEALAKLNATTVGDSFDITLKKIVIADDGTEGAPVLVKDAQKEISITIGIPTAMQGGSDYTVIRVHGTNATALPTTEHDNKLTFKSDKFSTYSIAYRPKLNPDGQKYNFTGGGQDGKYAAGAKIAIDAGTKSGYTFTGWTSSSSGGSFADPSKAQTTFTMPARDTTVTAGWKLNSTGGNYYPPSGGSGSVSSPDITPEIQKPNIPTTAETTIKETADGKGNSTAVISPGDISSAIDNAKADTVKNGKEQNGISISVNIGNGEKTFGSTAVNLLKATQELLIKNEVKSFSLYFASSNLYTTLDLEAIKSIYAQSKSDVMLTITSLNAKSFKGDAQTAIGTRPAYNLTATYENGKQRIYVFGGSMCIEIPYTLQKDEQAGSVFLVSVDKNNVKWIDYSSYNQKRGTLVGLVDTFTDFGVGYKAVTSSKTENNDVIFIKSRTQINALKEKLFPSDRTVTRQEATVIIANYARKTDFNLLPVTREAISFSDSASISESAAADVLAMQQAGVAMAKSAKLFCPQETASASEIASMLHRYIELVISRKTTEGFHQNDSEQWMYFSNGKALTGLHTIKGEAYEFDSDGILVNKPVSKKYTTYTVKMDDWVSKIAIKFGCTTAEIVELNNLKTPDLIFAGQQFVVPLK